MSLSILKTTLLIIITSLCFASCKKDKTSELGNNTSEIPQCSIQFYVTVKSNNLSVIWDSLNNINAAGNIYSINKLNLFIANISLKKDDGTIYKNNKIYYVNPRLNTKNSFQLDSIPIGNYIEFSCIMGIDSLRNVSLGLESTVDNINMAWPNGMGGGYHFIKMEGHYIDTAGIVRGYAVHLGKNEHLVKIKLTKSLSLINKIHNCSLVFNTNEMFQNPYVYNLNFEKNYTMSDSISMSKIKVNSQDVFTLIQNN